MKLSEINDFDLSMLLKFVINFGLF